MASELVESVVYSNHSMDSAQNYDDMLCTNPLRNPTELLEYKRHHNIAKLIYPKVEKRQNFSKRKLFVCHDMRGNYLNDRSVVMPI